MLKIEESTIEMFNLTGLKVLFPKIQHYINRLKNGGFYFVKINHAFWEMLSGNKYWTDLYLKIHDKDLIDEVLGIIKTIDKTNILLAVSNLGPPHYMRKSDSEIAMSKKIIEILPEGYIAHFACNWKIFSLDGSIHKFYDVIREKKLVIVGMEHLEILRDTLNLKNMLHYKLTFQSSQKITRDIILNDLLAIANKDEKTIFIFQAGDLFSTWLIYHMSQKMIFKNCSLIDMGRSVDIFCANRTLCEQDKNILPDFFNQKWQEGCARDVLFQQDKKDWATLVNCTKNDVTTELKQTRSSWLGRLTIKDQEGMK